MRKTSAFTLIELLVVIVIIGILSAIGIATFQSYFAKARNAERIATVSQFEKLLRIFHGFEEYWPAPYGVNCNNGYGGIETVNTVSVPYICSGLSSNSNCWNNTSLQVCPSCLGDYSDDKCWGAGTSSTNSYREANYLHNLVETVVGDSLPGVEGAFGSEAFKYEGIIYVCHTPQNGRCDDAMIGWFNEDDSDNCGTGVPAITNYNGSGQTLCYIPLED